MTDSDFAALKSIVNYARSSPRCNLAQAKSHARHNGHEQEAVDRAAAYWAKYESEKHYD